VPGPDDVSAVAKAWGVKRGTAIVEEVTEAVRRFRAIAKRCRVPRANIDEVGRDIGRRLKRLTDESTQGGR
jgi:hypothetical protein